MLRPLRDRIVVKPIPRVKSEIIEVISNEKDNLGTVVRTGPKARGVRPGDKIRFGTSDEYLSFPEFHEAGERFLVLQEADICWIEERERLV